MGRLLIAILTLKLTLAISLCQAAERVALVIGNSKYNHAPKLRNARRDAESISDKLKALSFDVTEIFDADMRAFTRSFTIFQDKASKSEVAMIYFAGHGLQILGENFLLTSDFDPHAINHRDDLGINLRDMIRQLRVAHTKRLVFLIDACRDNPFDTETGTKILARGAEVLGRKVNDTSRNLQRGLAPIDSAIAIDSQSQDTGDALYMYSAQPGRTAEDGSGINSPFAEAVLMSLGKQDLDVVGVFTEVSRYVVETTQGVQRPELRISWSTHNFFLNPRVQARNVIRYLMSNAKPGDQLYEQHVDELIDFYKPEHLHGPFNAAGSLMTNISEENWLYKGRVDRTKFNPIKSGIGHANGFAIDLDFGGDGQMESLVVRDGQVGVEFYILKAGVWHRFTPVCPKHSLSEEQKAGGSDEDIESVEVAILDINNNRKADIWIATRHKDQAWPDLCIVEYTGNVRKVDHISHGSQETIWDPFIVQPLISNTAGWGVRVLTDRSIEICAGSYCANRWTFRWNGSKFEERQDGALVREFVAVGWDPGVASVWLKEINPRQETSSVSSGPTGANDPAIAVKAFYGALSRADGKAAAALIVPEKRRTGPFSEDGITQFYSALRAPLLLQSVEPADNDTVYVKYSFTRANGTVCNGNATVRVTRRDGKALIQGISANC
jgi:Caspase domain